MPRVLLLVSLALCSHAARAQDAGLYEGEVPVDSQGADKRAAAVPAALAQVLVKVSGNRAAAASAAGQGSAQMQQYRYRQDVVNIGGVPTIKLFLIARFDQTAVEQLLARGGYSVWPEPRPKPVLWLAIDDGSGARLVGEAQASAIASLRARAAQRGMTLRLPKNDDTDQLSATPEAVIGGDTESLLAATGRYGGGPILVGRLQRSGGGWSAGWIVHDGSRELARFNSDDPSAVTALAGGADGAADALSKVYSTEILSGTAGRYPVVVQGLQQAEDYARVLQTLRALPVVRSVTPGAVAGDRVELDVDLNTGVEGLTRLLERGGVLRGVSPGDETQATVFQLNR